jgi:hypothetical protein
LKSEGVQREDSSSPSEIYGCSSDGDFGRKSGKRCFPWNMLSPERQCGLVRRQVRTGPTLGSFHLPLGCSPRYHWAFPTPLPNLEDNRAWGNIHACVDCSLGVQPETARGIRKAPVVSAAHEKGQTNGGRRAFASPASTTNVPSNQNIVTPPQCHHPICRPGREADGRMPFARLSGASNWVRVKVGRMVALHLPPHQGRGTLYRPLPASLDERDGSLWGECH